MLARVNWDALNQTFTDFFDRTEYLVSAIIQNLELVSIRRPVEMYYVCTSLILRSWQYESDVTQTGGCMYSDFGNVSSRKVTTVQFV
jgi:hypothetical protein